MDGQVQSHKFHELILFITQHLREIPAPILFMIYCSDGGAISVQVSVDYGSNCRKLGKHIHGIFICILNKS